MHLQRAILRSGSARLWGWVQVRIAAKSGVMSNIDKPGDYAGFPAVCLSVASLHINKLTKPPTRPPPHPYLFSPFSGRFISAYLQDLHVDNSKDVLPV